MQERKRKRVCCNCGNNIRKKMDGGHVQCYCQIDGHYIGYIACFEDWCRRWRKERKWEKDGKSKQRTISA